MIPAVVYRRVSSAQQGRKTDRTDGGWSLQSQEAKAAGYAEKHGLTIVRVFEEVGSAAKRGRPVFAVLVTYLRKHSGTALVVEKLDRLARNSHDQATVDEMIDAGVAIHLIRDGKILHAGSSPGERLSSDIEADTRPSRHAPHHRCSIQRRKSRLLHCERVRRGIEVIPELARALEARRMLRPTFLVSATTSSSVGAGTGTKRTAPSSRTV